MQPNPTHRSAPPDAAALAQQGPHVCKPHTTRCACGTRGSLRGHQPHQIYRARNVPEPPRLQEASPPSRRRVRFLQPRSITHPLRRSSLSRGSPVHLLVRVSKTEPVRKP